MIFSNNASSEFGGALVFEIETNSLVNIFNSLFYDNEASTAGAIYSSGGTMNIVNSTITQNTAEITGGVRSGGINTYFMNTIFLTEVKSPVLRM